MTRGPKPKPTAIRRAEGNRGKRAWNHDEPVPPEGTPDCPPHLSGPARDEWYRLITTLVEMGVVTVVDRAVLAAYCQAYGRWAEAEEKLAETPLLIRTPSGYVQQSPWLGIANRQMELMGRFMGELGLTPAARSRIVGLAVSPAVEKIDRVERIIVHWQGGNEVVHQTLLDGAVSQARDVTPVEPRPVPNCDGGL